MVASSVCYLRRLYLEPVKSSRIGFKNLYLRRVADILSLLNLAYDEGLAVTMRHIRSEHHVVLSDELNNLRQQDIVCFRAEKEIPFTHVFHRRQGMLWCRLRMKSRKLVTRAPEAVVHSLEHKMNPLAAGLQEGNSQVGKTVQHAAAD